MEIINLNYDDFRSNSYLIQVNINGNSKTYLIDPSVELRILKKYEIKLDGILITHGHIDHILTLKELYDYYHCPVYCHVNAVEKIKNNVLNCAKIYGFDKDLDINDYKIIHEGDLIENLFRVIETPGHTNCSVCFLMNYDNENIMFSGDTLFKRGVGRTDLYTGNSSQLIKSLKKIIGLKLDYKIYPGHDDWTFLCEEKVNNEYIKKL